MKKLVCIVLMLVMVFSLGACVDISDTGTDKIPTDGASTPSVGDSSVQLPAQALTIAESVIFEQNGIKVTVKGLETTGLFGPSVKVLIENNSAQNITVQARDSSVNGVMIDTLFSEDVAVGKKANGTITFSSTQLKAASINTLKDIEFSLHIFDSDSWDTIVDTNPICLTTSADASFVQTYDDSGFVAYNEGGIKVVVKKLSSEDSFWGSEVYLYIENNTTQNITVQVRDVSIDGFMVDPIFSCDIVGGKKAFDSITFLESDLTDNGLTDIKELELKLHIFNADTWNNIHDSDIIKIAFN